MTVVRTISASFAITGADSVTDVLGGAQLWAVPAAGVEYDADAAGAGRERSRSGIRRAAGMDRSTRTLSGLTEHQRAFGLAARKRRNTQRTSGIGCSALAERLGVKGGDRVVVGGRSLVVDVSGSGQSLTVASSLAQTVVGGNGWWLVFAPPGDEKKRDLGQTFGSSVGLESTADPSVMPDPNGRGLVYDTVGGTGPLTFEQKFSPLFSRKVAGSTLGVISTMVSGSASSSPCPRT